MSSGGSVAGRGPGPGARRRGGHRSLPANNIHILEEDEVLARPRTPPTSEYLIEVETGLTGSFTMLEEGPKYGGFKDLC